MLGQGGYGEGRSQIIPALAPPPTLPQPNSEIATSVLLGKKLNIVLLDNGGFGCIDRLQRSCGGASFNNLFLDGSGIDFAGHAASLGASSRKVAGLAELEAALPEIRGERRSSVIV